MAASFALTGERATVRLSDVPLEVRIDACEKAAKAWDLDPFAYLELRMIAQSASPDAELSVDVAKIDRVMSGLPVPGAIPVFTDPKPRRRGRVPGR